MVRQELWGKADHSIPRITWVTEDPASKNALQWTMARVTGDGSDAPGWCLNMVEQEHWEKKYSNLVQQDHCRKADHSIPRITEVTEDQPERNAFYNEINLVR